MSVINKFDTDGYPDSWTSDTELNGDVMQESLDMLLANDSALLHSMTTVELDVGEDDPLTISDLSFIKKTGRMNEVYYQISGTYTSGTTTYNTPLGYTVPHPGQVQGGDSNYAALFCNTSATPSFFWGSLSPVWCKTVSLAKKSFTFSSTSTRFLYTTITIPTESGSLPNTEFFVRVQGKLDLTIYDTSKSRYYGPTYSPFGLSLSSTYGTSLSQIIPMPFCNFAQDFTVTDSDGNTTTTTEFSVGINQYCYYFVDLVIPSSSISSTSVPIYLGFEAAAPAMIVTADSTDLLVSTVLR